MVIINPSTKNIEISKGLPQENLSKLQILSENVKSNAESHKPFLNYMYIKVVFYIMYIFCHFAKNLKQKITVVLRPCDAQVGNVGPSEIIDWFEFQDGDTIRFKFVYTF